MARQVDIRSNVAEAGSTQINNVNNVKNVNFNTFTLRDSVDIDRCLRILQWPDSLKIKNRLSSTKDKVITGTTNWILSDPHYANWCNGDDIGLLWIKGGAGKGKTMIIIDLIQHAFRPQGDTVTLAYFFCQSTDYHLNTLGSIIKGLIWSLVKQREELQRILRSRWDSVTEAFSDDFASWKTLWDVFIEMLANCKCSKIFIIVDAIDECQDEDIREFLRTLVRSGLHDNSKAKWLLTSRPFEIGEQELLFSADQASISMESNVEHVSPLVKAYIASKVAGLDRRHSYGQSLRLQIEAELIEKAENTFLWAGVVCRTLEDVDRENALTAIQNSPTSLYGVFDQMMEQLSNSSQILAKRSFRLLKAMTLAFRPLNVNEVQAATGFSNEEVDFDVIIGRCASFLNIYNGYSLEFVHGSLREFLTEGQGHIQLNANEQYGHLEMSFNSVVHLQKQLKTNFIDLPRPDSEDTMEAIHMIDDRRVLQLGANLQYAAVYWARHLDSAEKSQTMQQTLPDLRLIDTFVRDRLLEWFEYLSILGLLPHALDALKLLKPIIDLRGDPSTVDLIKDATRFLNRHYETIARWPLQIYSAALLFSPQASVVRQSNLNRVPKWLQKVPALIEEWQALVQTIRAHPSSVQAVAFSPDGNNIASAAYERRVKVWRTETGRLEKVFKPPVDQEGGAIFALAYSSDGQWIAYGGLDNLVTIRSCKDDHIHRTLPGHSDAIDFVQFSPDSSRIISASWQNIRVWDVASGNLQVVIATNQPNPALAVSNDGKHIAAGSTDRIIRLWGSTDGMPQQWMECQRGSIEALAYSPDDKTIVLASGYGSISLWSETLDREYWAVEGDSEGMNMSLRINSLAFSPDGKCIASGSEDGAIRLWESTTGQYLGAMLGHAGRIISLDFSPDGTVIASASVDETVRLWDSTVPDASAVTIDRDEGKIESVAFSPDGKRIVSVASRGRIHLWDNSKEHLDSTPILTMPRRSGGDVLEDVVFSFDGKLIASACSKNFLLDLEQLANETETKESFSSGLGDHYAVEIWNSVTGDFIREIRTDHGNWIAFLNFSRDGRWIASASIDRSIKLWSVATGKLQITIPMSGPAFLTGVAFSRDDKRLIAASTAENFSKNTVMLWDIHEVLKSPKLLARFRSDRKLPPMHSIQTPMPVYKFQFSPDGKGVATDAGIIAIADILQGNNKIETGGIGTFCVTKGWICCGTVRLLWLGTDLRSSACDVRGDQIVVGFAEGRIIRFDLDMNRLLSSFRINKEKGELEMVFPADDTTSSAGPFRIEMLHGR